jgi:hypothetical protein
MSELYIPRGAGKRQVAVTQIFNIDNGAGTVINDAFLMVSQPISIKSAKVLYTTATTGTVAAATISLGTTVAGVELVAATALENTKTVGTTTALTLTAAAAKVAANTMITASHTGVATTAAGEYRVVVEYEILY